MNNPDEDILADIGMLYTLLRRRFDRIMSAQGASLAQNKMLIFILFGDGKFRAADIAERSGLAPRTVTEALDCLERDGLIVRTPDPSDRRSKRLQVTAAGKLAAAKTEPLRQQIAHDIMSVLDDNERACLATAVKKLLHCNEWD